MTGEKIFGVDLDGTLCEKTDYDGVGFASAKPRLKNIELINDLARAGHFIIIWTCRSENYRNVTEFWLKENDIHYNVLVMDKLHVDVYVDEKRKLMTVENCEGEE